MGKPNSMPHGLSRIRYGECRCRFLLISFLLLCSGVSGISNNSQKGATNGIRDVVDVRNIGDIVSNQAKLRSSRGFPESKLETSLNRKVPPNTIDMKHSRFLTYDTGGESFYRRSESNYEEWDLFHRNLQNESNGTDIAVGNSTTFNNATINNATINNATISTVNDTISISNITTSVVTNIDINTTDDRVNVTLNTTEVDENVVVDLSKATFATTLSLGIISILLTSLSWIFVYVYRNNARVAIGQPPCKLSKLQKE